MIPGSTVPDFDNTLATLIERYEGWSPTAYFNTGDVPTIGYGVAFIFEGQGGYQARTLEELNDWFSGIYVFTQSEQTVLANIAAALNANDETTAMQLFNGWGPAAALSLTEAYGELILSRAVPEMSRKTRFLRIFWMD